MKVFITRNHPALVASLFCFLVLTAGRSQTAQSLQVLGRSTPEAEGVSSAGILKFLDAAASGKNELHSYVIVRHGKIISEGWWHPYGKDLRHMMFSVSKSFTSTGVGFAVDEGKIKLTDKVSSFFPKSMPDTMGAYMREMTVRDLLMMATGMNADPLFAGARNAPDWPKAFLSASVENKPGTVFKYNNMATFMLSAIVQKATGQKLFDYLKPRLFEPLGITNVTFDETPEGYTFGAIGLRLQSEDMAKFGQMLLQKGKWGNKQVVPGSWVEEATSFKIPSNDPNNKRPKEQNDWEQGYCYQFWRCRNNAYRADGLGGQFIIVLPEKDAVVVLTASSTDTQEELNLVWDHLLPAMQVKTLPADKNSNTELIRRASALAVSPASSPAGDPALLSRISGKTIQFDGNESGIATLKISIATTKDAVVQIDRGGNERFEFTAGKEKWQLNQTRLYTLGAAPRANQALPQQLAARYAMTDAATLELTAKFVEESIWSEIWSVRFEEKSAETKVHLEIKGVRPRTLEGKIVD